ncbi:hypothetical protein BD410DRAFT_116394 [Rickenella mellea]|uniref:Chloride channel protein n=1 Tax=Rickenella mellea TaxID=50990 RepID=A0A4Y7QBV1_9AGAM|nr:hypothetical protein BD410DRAFT_116394 [Rickenella mellea]
MQSPNTQGSRSVDSFSDVSPVLQRRSDNLEAIGSPQASSPTRRRHRDPGSSARNGSSETTQLAASAQNIPSYGTVPALRSPPPGKRSFRSRRGFPSLPDILTSPQRTGSFPATPTFPRTYSFSRPISTYDATNHPEEVYNDADAIPDTQLNGVRVWYSSFSSVDWLHDAIKESSRVWRLRSRKSVRGRIRSALDRSVDWITVTIVGFLTAIVAFIIIRSEQVLFDLKEGRCSKGWWLAKRFCSDWEDWSEIFGAESGENGPKTWIGFAPWALDYISYIVVALLLALVSSLLTIYLTASTSFTTHKDYAVATHFNSDSKTATAPQKRKILYFAAGSGIPEIKTILSGFVIHGYLGARTLFTKAVGLTLSVASGLSLGKEGPFVHIACCIGNIVSRYFPKYEANEGKRREVLSAAAAAGVAVAFGAPIGGVLFSLEEVSYYFPPKVMWQSFFCAMIAAMTLRFLDPFGTGKLVLFQVTYDKDWHAYELIFFLFLGVFGGVYGALFSKLNYRWSRYVRNGTWLGSHPVSEVLLITLITAFLSFLNPYTRMGGTELVYNLFAECRGDKQSGLCVRDPSLLLGPVTRSIGLALLVKGALTVVTFGIKLPAGIFIPTLGVGACFGRILGIIVQNLQFRHPDLPMFRACKGDTDCVIPGLYAMVGAAATLSGVTRTTVSLAVIMFELTDTLTYAVPVMLSILAAKTIADAIEPKGIYDLVIDLSQLPYLDAKREYVWEKLRVSDVTDRDVDIIRVDEENTIKSLRMKLQNFVSAYYADSGFPIVRREAGGMKMIGYIGLNELEHALSIVTLGDDAPCYFNPASSIGPVDSESSFTETPTGPDPLDFSLFMDQAPLTVQTHSPLELVQQLFAKLGAKYVIVTDPNGYYEGVIDKNAWIAFLNSLEDS